MYLPDLAVDPMRELRLLGKVTNSKVRLSIQYLYSLVFLEAVEPPGA